MSISSVFARNKLGPKTVAKFRADILFCGSKVETFNKNVVNFFNKL